MDTRTYIDVIADESARALRVLRGTDLSAPVPSAPDWTAADLAWHLGRVQWFWGTIVADLVQDPGPLVEPERPADGDLADFLAAQTDLLVTALGSRDPADRCWSWLEGHDTVGWVARRQAHEALIHRADAELAAPQPVSAAPVDLADDGVQELLADMIRIPRWATFTTDRSAVRVDATDTGSVWTMVLGRMTGTSPRSGRPLDKPAAALAGDEGPAQVAATIYGTAWDLDLWLWGRGPIDALDVHGDVGQADRLRVIAAI